MNTCGVYQIENVSTGKRYIGSSIHMERRLYDHRRMLIAGEHHNIHLQRAWNFSGSNAFKFAFLVVLEKKDQLETEQRIIDGLTAAGESLYNIAKSVTAPNIGVVASDATRAKLSAAHVRRFSDPSAREQVSNSLKRTLRSPEARERMSRASLESAKVDGVAERKSAGMRAYYAKPGSREKLSASLAGRAFTQKQINVFASASRQYSQSPDGRKARSEMMKARWADPVAREKILTAKNAALAAKKRV